MIQQEQILWQEKPRKILIIMWEQAWTSMTKTSKQYSEPQHWLYESVETIIIRRRVDLFGPSAFCYYGHVTKTWSENGSIVFLCFPAVTVLEKLDISKNTSEYDVPNDYFHVSVGSVL